MTGIPVRLLNLLFSQQLLALLGVYMNIYGVKAIGLGNLVKVMISSVTQSGSTFCNPVDHSTPGLPVHHQLPEFSVQFSSVAQLSPTLCDPMNWSTPGLPVHHQLLEFTQTHVHWVGVAIQPFRPLSAPSPSALNLPQHQGLFKWVSSSYQVAKGLEFQLQHRSFWWTLRTDFL